MTVALLPPLRPGLIDSRILLEPLKEAPSFIAKRHPQRSGWLWHRPRSGVLMLREWLPDDLATLWHFWCGQTARADQAEAVEVLPADAAVCATCEGRAQGAGQIPSTTGHRTSFTARGSVPPRWCPGSGRSGLWRPYGSTTGRCGVCGGVEATRAMGGVWNGGVGIVRHVAARDLLEVRCDLHGWQQLVLDDSGDAVCACARHAGR